MPDQELTVKGVLENDGCKEDEKKLLLYDLD